MGQNALLKRDLRKDVVWRDFDPQHPEKELRLKFFSDGTMRAEFKYSMEDENGVIEYNSEKNLCALLSNEVVNLLYAELINAKEEGLF